MIEVRQLKKIIEGKKILEIPHLVFAENKINGLIGKNGSGKSTLLRLVLDLDVPTQGTILIDGIPNTTSELWKKKIGAYLDEDFLVGFLTPEEYFELLFKLRGVGSHSYSEFISAMEKFFAGEILNQQKSISSFSKGNKQKIGIAGTFIGNVNTLIMDEPFSHLDEESQHELKSLLKTVNLESKLTIILTSHNLSFTEDLFDTVTTLHDGQLVLHHKSVQ